MKDPSEVRGGANEAATSNAHSWKCAGVLSGQIDSETHLCAVVGIGFNNKVHTIAKRVTALSIGELFTWVSLLGRQVLRVIESLAET